MNAPSFRTDVSGEEREALRDAMRRLMADHCTQADVRRTMETPEGYDRALWRRLADMGIAGLVIDEAHGGSGAGPVELETVMEEAGAALLCSPLLGSSILTAGLIGSLKDDAAAKRLSPGMASGQTIAAAALTGDAGGWTPQTVEVLADLTQAGWRLDGVASYVIHGQNADVLLVVARNETGSAVFEVDPKQAGVVVTPLPTFDHTIRLARIVFTDATGVRLDAAGPVWPAVQGAIDLALVALAGEQAGAARRCFDQTVDYAKTRIQFGRPIGGFQAIKHMAADLLLETESAISAARSAAAKLSAGAADTDIAVSLAAFACADAFVTVAADSIQMHGGVAFTWEHPAHLYLRRARSSAQLFGGSEFYRERYLKALEARDGQ